MKKRTIGCLAILSSLFITSLVACNINVEPVENEAPTISASESGLSFDGSSKTVVYSVDNGEWVEGSSLAFSQVEGSHTVRAKVKEGDNETSKEASFAYESKAVSLSDITLEGSTASWSVVAYKEYLKVADGEYSETTAKSYTSEITASISVKAVGGWDSGAKIYYFGDEVVKTKEIIVMQNLSAPEISLNATNDGVSVGTVSNATGYLIKVDDGEYASGNEAKFSTVAGEHTIKAKAVGDGVYYGESAEVTFSYTVKDTSITVNKTSRFEASWTYEGTALLKDGVAYTGNSYISTATETVELIAKAGWDGENKVYYPADYSYSLKFIADSASAYVIEDGENKVDADLQDEWTAKKYNNGWVDTSASIVSATSRSSKGIALKVWNNYSTFKFSKGYSVKDGYNAISFDLKGDDVATFKVQLMNSKTGIYTTFNLGKTTSNWKHVALSMADSNWKINLSGQDYSLKDVIDQVGLKDTNEVLQYFDTFSLLTYGETAIGSSTTIYLDDIKFENIENVATILDGAYLDDTKTEYVAQNAAGLMMKYQATGNTEGVVSTLNYMQIDTTQTSEISVPVTIAISGETITIVDKDGGNYINLVGKFSHDGASLKITSGGGAYGSVFNGLSFASAANVSLDFEDGAGSDKYINSDWSQYYYGSSGWVATEKQMNSRSKSGSKVVNMYASGTTFLYKYNENGKSLGHANHFSVDLGNYYGSGALKVKISVVDMSGNKHYIKGTASEFYEMAMTSALDDKVDYYFDSAIEARQIEFAIQASSDKYLYVDNVVLNYQAKPAEDPEESEEPEVTYANLNLDFEEGTVGNAVTDTMWTRERYESSWVTLTGNMYYKQISGSSNKIINFHGGWGYAYNYTYNKGGASLGIANHVSLKLSNHYSQVEIPIKLAVIDTSGAKHYLAGDASSTYSMPTTTGLVAQEFNLGSDIDVASFQITVKSSAQKDVYIYMDDLVINHVA